MTSLLLYISPTLRHAIVVTLFGFITSQTSHANAQTNRNIAAKSEQTPSASVPHLNPTNTSILPISATEQLALADEYRNFKDQSFSFDLTLINQEPGKTPKEFALHAKVFNSHTSLVAYTRPKREQGKALLMNGRHLWFFSRLAKRPIRITPQQRLIGEASNGDVASTDFSGDYDASYYQSDKSDKSDRIILLLNAKIDSLAAYSKVLLWLNSSNSRPDKAEFYSATGKHLKTAYYTKYQKLDTAPEGKEQLVQIEIHNAINKNSITTMNYSNFKLVELTESQFRPNQISQLMPKL